MDLHVARPGGWSVGGIPASEVIAWLNLKGIEDPGVRRDYATVVRIVDHEFLANRKEWSGEKEEEEKEEQAKKEAEEKKAAAKRQRARRGR